MAFAARYCADDGYVNGGRPLTFKVHEDDILNGVAFDATDKELRIIFEDMVAQDFRERVAPGGLNTDEFIQWARGILAAQEGKQ